MGASADAVMLNEARNKAQEASILSVAVMSVIKGHRQDVITGQTHCLLLSAQLWDRRSRSECLSASYFHILTQKATARCKSEEKLVDLCCVRCLRAECSAHSSLSSISDSYFRYLKLFLNASVRASRCAWLPATTSTPPAPSRPSVASLFLGRTSCVWRARSSISKLGMTKAR